MTLLRTRRRLKHEFGFDLILGAIRDAAFENVVACLQNQGPLLSLDEADNCVRAGHALPIQRLEQRIQVIFSSFQIP